MYLFIHRRRNYTRPPGSPSVKMEIHRRGLKNTTNINSISSKKRRERRVKERRIRENLDKDSLNTGVVR